MFAARVRPFLRLACLAGLLSPLYGRPVWQGSQTGSEASGHLLLDREDGGRAGSPYQAAALLPGDIAILQVTSDKSEPISQQSIQNKVEYAKEHGYTHLVEGHLDPTRHPSWSKIPAIQKHLHQYKWLFVVDIDTIIMNPHITLESIILGYQRHHPHMEMLLGRECGAINMGVFFLRNSPWAHNFMSLLYGTNATNKADPYWALDWEQDSFAELYEKQQPTDVHERVAVVRNTAFNSLAPDHCGVAYQYEPGDFLVHMVGGEKASRWQKWWLSPFHCSVDSHTPICSDLQPPKVAGSHAHRAQHIR